MENKRLQCCRCKHQHTQNDRVTGPYSGQPIMDLLCPKCNAKTAYLLPEKVTPFSNGTQLMNWHSNNCSRCIHYENESTRIEDAKCKLAFELDIAVIGEGYISIDTALEMGYSMGKGLNYDCKKRQIYKKHPKKHKNQSFQTKLDF